MGLKDIIFSICPKKRPDPQGCQSFVGHLLSDKTRKVLPEKTSIPAAYQLRITNYGITKISKKPGKCSDLWTHQKYHKMTSV